MVQIDHRSYYYSKADLELIDDQASIPAKPALKKSRDLTGKLVKSADGSSTIRSYVYHNKSLIVTFRSGSVYQYLNVPLVTIKQFKNAPSRGSFLSDVIQPNFNYLRLA